MKFDAVCTNINSIYTQYRATNGTVQVRQMFADVTFTIFRKQKNETITLPFEFEEMPNIGEKYEIEVCPCK